MAGFDALLLKIALVVLLGRVERSRRHDLRHTWTLENAGRFERRLRLAGGGFLFGIMEENRRAVLRAEIGALAVHLRRVVALEENREQLAVGDFAWIELDFDGLGMTSLTCANLFV